MSNLAKSAQSVQDVLINAGLNCKVIEFPCGTKTSLDAAKAIGCNLAQIAKSLIFMTKNTAMPILVIASGPNKVDEKIIEFHVNEPVVRADAIFVKEITGFAIGGIPSIGHKQMIHKVFMDHLFMQFDEVWSAAGTPNAVFCIKSKDLVAITKAKVIELKKE